MKRRTISPKENYMRAMRRDERPEWLPLSTEDARVIFPGLVCERPIYGSEGGKDWFGCSWIWDPECMGFAPDVKNPPLLDDITEWRDVVQFPDLDSYDWESIAAKDLEGIDPDEVAVCFMSESGPFERTHHLLGFENALVAMLDEPEEFKALVDAIADFKIDWFNHIYPYYKPEVIIQMDDLGTATGPFMALDVYRELLLPAHTRISECIRGFGALHMHHSCGKMVSFLPDLIGAGASIFNGLQRMNNRQEVAKRFSKDASFDIVLDTVNNPQSTEQDIIDEIHETLDAFAPYGNIAICPFTSNIHTMDRLGFVLEELKAYAEKVW